MHYKIPQSILDQCPPSVLIKDQKQKKLPKFYKENGDNLCITPELRYDDQCGNGHNTFAITATIQVKEHGRWTDWTGGCCHTEIAHHFPGLAPFIKWHLVSSDFPLHYLANTLYHAGDRDHWGLRKGEFKQLIDRHTGLPCWKLEAQANPPPPKYIDANECPPDEIFHYVPRGIIGEGKARELDHARSSAVWPEATDEQLSLPEEELAQLLITRLPALMWDFKKDMESLGFFY